jgi:hypothetical protein
LGNDKRLSVELPVILLAVGDQLNTIYQEVLGRGIGMCVGNEQTLEGTDKCSYETYTVRLSTDCDLACVRRELAKGEEAAKQLEQIYIAILDRQTDPKIDPSGLEHYSNELANSRDVVWVRQDIAKQPEACDRLMEISQEVLGRSFSKAECTDYRLGTRTILEHLTNGWSLTRVRDALIDSDEGHTLLARIARARNGVLVLPAGSYTAPRSLDKPVRIESRGGSAVISK